MSLKVKHGKATVMHLSANQESDVEVTLLAKEANLAMSHQ
jgi:hypothetical protein